MKSMTTFCFGFIMGVLALWLIGHSPVQRSQIWSGELSSDRLFGKTSSERLVLGVPESRARERLAELDARVEALTLAHEEALVDARTGRRIRLSASKITDDSRARLEEIARIRAQATTLREALAAR